MKLPLSSGSKCAVAIISALAIAAYAPPSISTPVEIQQRDVMSAVGVVNCVYGGKNFSSNAVVLEDRSLVLTVSHFNFDKRIRQELPISSCRFKLADPDARGTVFVSRFTVADRGASRMELNDSFALDWAVLRLRKPAPVTPLKLGHLGSQAASRSASLYSPIGSTATASRAASVQSDCDLRRERENSIVLLHGCQTGPGMSGSPFVSHRERGPRVIAIHAKRTRQSAIAVGIDGQMRHAILKEASRNVSQDFWR